MINIIISYSGGSITLPINPENIQVIRPSAGIVTEVVGIGEIIIPQTVGLATTTIKSFFWAQRTGTPSKTYVDAITAWQLSKTPARLTAVTTDANNPLNYDFLVNIESFDYDVRASEEEDVYYEIKMKEYRPYGARVVQMESATTATAPEQPRVDNSSPVTNTYTVKDGDCLWHIAKQLSDQNGRDWQELYDLNKDVLGAIVGDRPEQMHPGDVLTLPESWQ